jgi:enoyl-CoA hydratase/carnithine racemase
MTTLDQYANKYENVRMERQNGILQITLHTNGDTLQWGAVPHRKLPHAFADIGADPENKVVIMTGVGEGFTGPQGSRDTIPRRTPAQWDSTYWEGKHLLMNLLDIEVPMISAINGPALRHSELPLLCDIVLAAEETTFQDSGHFMNGLIPGDGMHIVYPLLLGMNRGRYFLLTGQKLSAHEAKELGLVNEVLARDQLLPRAWELAGQLAQQPPLVLRYSRVLLTQYIKRQMHDLLGYGLSLEGLGSAQDQLERGS